jgi:Zn-dependent protease
MDHGGVLAVVLWFPAFLISTTVHEAAHAWAALRGGDRTAYLGGQVSLSPLPHIRREPIGMLVVPLLTSFTQGWAMGWASAPYDPDWAERHPRRAAWMAAAGPAGNFGIAIAAFLALRAGLALGWFMAPDHVTFSQLVAPASTGTPTGMIGFAGAMLSVLLMLNVILGAFNLVPLPPLDGSWIASWGLPRPIAAVYDRIVEPYGQWILLILFATGILGSIVSPISGAILNVLAWLVYR